MAVDVIHPCWTKAQKRGDKTRKELARLRRLLGDKRRETVWLGVIHLFLPGEETTPYPVIYINARA